MTSYKAVKCTVTDRRKIPNFATVILFEQDEMARWLLREIVKKL
jgi:hypothetical protein